MDINSFSVYFLTLFLVTNSLDQTMEDGSIDYQEKCMEVYREGINVYYRRECVDDVSDASSRMTETRMKVLHVEVEDYARNRNQISTVICDVIRCDLASGTPNLMASRYR